jgi:hypothetical protein
LITSSLRLLAEPLEPPESELDELDELDVLDVLDELAAELKFDIKAT